MEAPEGLGTAVDVAKHYADKAVRNLYDMRELLPGELYSLATTIFANRLLLAVARPRQGFKNERDQQQRMMMAALTAIFQPADQWEKVYPTACQNGLKALQCVRQFTGDETFAPEFEAFMKAAL